MREKRNLLRAAVARLLVAMLLVVSSFAFGMTQPSPAQAAATAVVDDGSNNSGWTGEVSISPTGGNPGSAFTFSKNTLMGKTFGTSGSDFSGATIEFQAMFMDGKDHLAVFWGDGVNQTPSITNSVYLGPGGNPASGAAMAGQIGITGNLTSPQIYWHGLDGGISGTGSASVTSGLWEVNRWYDIKVSIGATSTSYFVNGVLIQTKATAIPVANVVTLGGDDRNGWGFSNGVYVDNISITPAIVPVALTYDINGGLGSFSDASVLPGASFNTAVEPSRSGYTFTGWLSGASNTPASTNFVANQSYTMGTSDLTLTAQWSALPHTITYDLNGGSGSTPTQADVATSGTFTTANTPVRTHWSFAGWSNGTTTTAANTSYTVGTENVTLTALWTRNSSSVTFDSQNWQTASVASTDQGIAATAPTNPTWYGYNFKGWSETTTGSLVDVSAVTITGTKTFFAIWEQKSLAGLTNLGSPDILNPHATFDRTITNSYGNTTTSIKVPGGALPSTFQVKVYTIDDDSFASQALGAGTYLISQVVAWADTATGSVGNIQDTAAGKPIEMTITSPSITIGAKVYALLGNSSRVLGTATENGRVTVTFSEDPVIIVEAGPPAVITPTPTGSVVASGTTKSSKLAFTGTDGSKLLIPTGGAFGLLIVGIGLVLVSRRRAKTKF